MLGGLQELGDQAEVILKLGGCLGEGAVGGFWAGVWGAADVTLLISAKPPHSGNCLQELVKALAPFKPKAICAPQPTLSRLPLTGTGPKPCRNQGTCPFRAQPARHPC